MTLSCPYSLKLVKYFENGDRDDDGVNGSGIESHPLLTLDDLNRPRSTSQDFRILMQ